MAMIRPEIDMKDSGIEYVGAIPKDWDLVRLRAYFGERKNKNKDGNETNLLSLSYGRIIRKNIDKTDGLLPASFNTYNIVEKNDIIIRPTDLQNDKRSLRTGLVTEHGIITSAYIDLMPIGNVDSRFVHYLLHSYDILKVFYNMGSGVRQGLNYSEFSKLKVPMPLLSEQQAIADYLDETCSRIDEIIAEAKASIDEYKELKQSILFETMTRGIQSDRKYKTCDYEWLGKVPEDWSLMKITHILDDNDSYPIGDGDHGLIKTDSYKSEGIPYIRVQNIGWGTPLLMDNVVYISKEDNERIKGSQLKPGDVLFVKTGATIGKTAIVPNNIPISNTTSHVGKITVSKEHNSKYIFYLLSSFIGYKQFWDIACMKATRPELSISEIKQMKVLIPSTRDEEDEIVEYLDNKLPEYETLICIKESLINDLEAYKKSLIYEVVTGKRRVV